MIMKTRITFLSLICVFLSLNLSSQTEDISNKDKFSWGVYLLSSVHIESTGVHDPERWSGIGLGVGTYHQFDSGFGFNTRLSYRNWDRNSLDKITVPLSVGPSYRFTTQSKVEVAFYGGVGPVLIIGNDYAGFFGGFDLGTEIYFPAWSNNEIFIRAGLAQGMTFNSGFNYLDFAVGLRL